MSIDALRTAAAALLRDRRVKMVLGYRLRGQRRVPVFITDAADADVLVFDSQCRQNLAAYLTKPEIRAHFPAGVVAGPATMRSLIVLAAESQISSDAIVVLAVNDSEYHGAMDLSGAAELLNERYAALAPQPELLAQAREVAAMSPQQRAAFWAEQFARCTRCFACRAACYGCYCPRCVVEKNTPQWISTAAMSHGNYAWNIIRAFHQAGRCTLCGACQAACPQGLPLMLLNLRVDLDVQKRFGYHAGYDLAAKPLIGSWKADDDDKFVR